MLKVRFLSGIVLLAILCTSLYCGSWILYSLIWLISMIGLFEYQRALVKGNWHFNLLNGAGFLGGSILFLGLFLKRLDFFLLIGVIYFLMTLILYVFSYPRYSHKELTQSVFGFLYIPALLLFICLTRDLPSGYILVWLIPICSWGSDTFAYCVGMLIGHHKMAPVLSPKKSIEGAVGGILGSGFLAGLLGYFQLSKDSNTLIFIIGIGMIGGFLSMIGDLVASGIKREYDIKDYGHLIPGHGGILDRFDSMIMISPIIFLLCYIFKII